ncbi:MAG: DUF1566 domain-containing protein [bacterium]
MKRTIISLMLLFGLSISPTSAFTAQIYGADAVLTPQVGDLMGGLGCFVGGEVPGQYDWTIGNCVPGGVPTDDMVFSTQDPTTGWRERMRITREGNVGIGTTTPNEKLSVAGVIESTSGGIKFPDNTVQTTAAGGGHYIGESYGGGIVFYVYDNGQHGLIAATADQSTSMRWYAGTYIRTRAQADGVGAGKANTAIIIASQGDGDGATYAARVCNEYSVTVDGVTYGDWYLPSKHELNSLYQQKDVVGGFGSYVYWSSTEISSGVAWGQSFDYGGQNYANKNVTLRVRAVRAF